MNNKLIILIALVAAVAIGVWVWNNTAPAENDQVNNNNQNEQQQNGEPNEEPAQRTVQLYFYNPEADKDETGNILCSKQGLVTVHRDIAVTNTPIQDTINLLLEGALTQQEVAQGVTTEFPLPGLTLVGANLANKVLTLEFNDPQNQTGGGSCRTGVLWAQIEATALQFAEVDQVQFIPEELFQP